MFIQLLPIKQIKTVLPYFVIEMMMVTLLIINVDILDFHLQNVWSFKDIAEPFYF